MDMHHKAWTVGHASTAHRTITYGHQLWQITRYNLRRRRRPGFPSLIIQSVSHPKAKQGTFDSTPHRTANAIYTRCILGGALELATINRSSINTGHGTHPALVASNPRFKQFGGSAGMLYHADVRCCLPTSVCRMLERSEDALGRLVLNRRRDSMLRHQIAQHRFPDWQVFPTVSACYESRPMGNECSRWLVIGLDPITPRILH